MEITTLDQKEQGEPGAPAESLAHRDAPWALWAEAGLSRGSHFLLCCPRPQ